MKIDLFGDNLTIFIQCENELLNHWLAYASWYSLNINLPHAQVKLLVKRTKDTSLYFDWAARRNINCYRYIEGSARGIIDCNKHADRPYLIIPPSVMAVKEFDKAWLDILNGKSNLIIENGIEFYVNSEDNKVSKNDSLCCGVATSSVATFVRYDDFNDFVCREWINKKGPFTKKVRTKTINEQKVIDLWNRAQATIDL